MGAKAIDIGRGALANVADVVRKEAASADLGAKMGQLADKVVQTVTKDVVMLASAAKRPIIERMPVPAQNSETARKPRDYCAAAIPSSA
jgi:hypothetical protein